MMISRKHNQIELSFDRLRERLAFKNINPFTSLLLPTGFICLLLIYVSLETNQRIRSQATPLQLDGPPANTSSMWFSVSPVEGGISITGNENQVFSIQNDGTGVNEFEQHLIVRRKQALNEVALANRMDQHAAMVVLSVDESLTYAHIRPIIYALSKAGISNYGFEGRVLGH